MASQCVSVFRSSLSLRYLYTLDGTSLQCTYQKTWPSAYVKKTRSNHENYSQACVGLEELKINVYTQVMCHECIKVTL